MVKLLPVPSSHGVKQNPAPINETLLKAQGLLVPGSQVTSTGGAGASLSCHILVAWGLGRQPWDPEAFQDWIASDLGTSLTVVTKDLGALR